MMINNSLLEGYAILRFRLERLNERERVLVLLSTLSVLLFLWYLLLYMPQSKGIDRTKASINGITQSTVQLSQKRVAIESLIKDNSISKLMERYQHVQTEMNDLENNIKRYQKRYIDYSQLNNLLYSILRQTANVSIVMFTNTSMVIEENYDQRPPSVPAVSASTPTPAATTSVQTTGAPVSASPPSGPKVERYQYKLILKGSYASITDYLSKLEATGWQLYWDKLIYVVQKHPDALATVEFYTLRPTEVDSSQTKGGQ